MNRTSKSNPIHPKWLVLIVLMLISYSLLQPKLNSRWGWNLPSLASLLSENSSSGEPEKGSGSPSDSLGEENLRYGLLRETKRQEFVSPAGLRYTRGSEEGHRLDHLARHLEDQPERPGRHGVFRGDMHRVLLWLDEAYQRNQIGAVGGESRVEDGRTVIEVTFSETIGYIGGREGARRRHPESKRLRMVLDGDRVITAFPF